jgi:hypothetical protein
MSTREEPMTALARLPLKAGGVVTCAAHATP